MKLLSLSSVFVSKMPEAIRNICFHVTHLILVDALFTNIKGKVAPMLFLLTEHHTCLKK
jgi:hypothetical protein